MAEYDVHTIIIPNWENCNIFWFDSTSLDSSAMFTQLSSVCGELLAENLPSRDHYILKCTPY